jgi:hypothetical protein
MFTPSDIAPVRLDYECIHCAYGIRHDSGDTS